MSPIADRSVTVVLAARIQDFERGMAAATAVTKKFEAELDKLRATSPSKIDAVGDAARGTAGDIDSMAVASKVGGRAVDDLGDEARGAARGLNHLDNEIDKVTRSSLEMAAATRVASSAGSATGGALSTAGKFGSNLRGAMIPALIGGVIAASPVIGATISAAVVGAVGTGGIIGGVVLAARDVRVKAAWSDMGTDLMTTLSKDSAVFVGPLIDAAGEFEFAFMRANSKISAGFENMSHTVEPLAKGLGGLGEGLAGMFERVSHVAEPMFEQWATQLPSLGNAFDNFGESMEQAGPQIREFWKDFEGGLEHTIVGLGNTLEFLTKAWSSIKEGTILMQDLARAASGMPGADQGLMVRGLGPLVQLQMQAHNANELLTKSEKDMADAAKAAADAIHAQDQAFHDLLSTEMQALNANLSFEQSMDDLTGSVHDNGHSLDIHSQKGRDNERAILQVVDALAAQRDAEFAATGSVDVANAHFQQQIGTLRNHLLQLGFNKGAVDALVSSIRSVPPHAESQVKVSGVSAANSGINDVKNHLLNLDGRVATVFIRSVTQTAGAGGFQPMARGTDFAPGGLALVGEEGPEIAYIPRGSRVFTHQQSVKMARMPGYAAGIGNWPGPTQTAPINVYGGGLGEAVMAYLRNEVGKQGGDVQAVLGGGRR